MTRRKSLLALGALTGALTNQAAEAQSTTPGVLKYSLKFSDEPATPLKFNLRAFSRYDFTLDGDTVSFTPEQLMAGLRGER